MNPPLNFASFAGNARAVRILRRALAQQRVPHALIFAGPEGVGKRTLAILLARRLHCLSLAADDACGSCRSCNKITHGAHPDLRVIEPEKTVITVGQVRDLIRQVAYHPFESKFRVVILDPAEQMRPEGANCLLKTLEEPASQTVLILVTTQPNFLLPTIHSRAQTITFTGIPQDQIAEHLIRAGGLAADKALLAASFSNGSLAAALSFDIDGYRQVRSQALRFVSLLFKKGVFAELSLLAAALHKDKDKDRFSAWLDATEAVLQDLYYAHASPQRMSQADIVGDLKDMSRRVARTDVLAAVREIKNLRRSLRFNVNRQIALEALYFSLSGESG